MSSKSQTQELPHSEYSSVFALGLGLVRLSHSDARLWTFHFVKTNGQTILNSGGFIRGLQGNQVAPPGKERTASSSNVRLVLAPVRVVNARRAGRRASERQGGALARRGMHRRTRRGWNLHANTAVLTAAYAINCWQQTSAGGR